MQVEFYPDICKVIGNEPKLGAKQTMAYFLRYTEQPTKDLKRGTSVHPSDIIDKKTAIEVLGDDITKVNGFWCQVIDGLCGFELEADNLEDAIEEVEDHRCGSYDFRTMGKMAVIFEGEITSEDVPEGCAFNPKSIAYKF